MGTTINKIRETFKDWKDQVAPYIPFTASWLLWKFLDKTSKSILDLGCGDGRVMLRLKRQKSDLYAIGIDIFAPYLKKAKARKSHDGFIRGDIRALPLCYKSFDVVLCREVIEHLDKKDGLILLNELARIARKQIIITTPIGWLKTHSEENSYQIHRSEWSPEEFQDRNYHVYGSGIRGLFGEKGLQHMLPLFLRNIVPKFLEIVTTPFSFYLPKFGGRLICIKDIRRSNHEKNYASIKNNL